MSGEKWSIGLIGAHEWHVEAGVSRYGDGPDHLVCIVRSSAADAQEICDAHNRAILTAKREADGQH